MWFRAIIGVSTPPTNIKVGTKSRIGCFDMNVAKIVVTYTIRGKYILIHGESSVTIP